MPKDSLNICLTIQDGMSPVLASITDKTKALDKETQQLQQTTNAMTKASQSLLEKQTRLQSEYDSSKKKLKEFQKAYDETHDVIDKTNLDSAIKEHARLKNELIEVTEQLNTNKRAYKENVEAIRKGGLSAISSGDEMSLKKVATGLLVGQVGQMFSSSIGEVLNMSLTSAMGTPQASLISDTLSNAIAGGTAGAMFGLPGIAAGVALGGFSGLISGQTKIWQAQDDAFKDYYGGLYEDVSGRSDETVESGSTIAGGREQTRKAFAHRFGGEEEADVYLSKVEKMAAETNYDYDEIVGYTKLLLNSYDPDEVFGVLRDLSDATAGLDLNSSDVNMMIAGLSRMRTTGKATQEYLNYFRERGVDTDQALTDYYKRQGKSVKKSEIAALVTKGDVSGDDAAEAILNYIEDTFGGLSNDLAGTYDAMVDNLGDITASLEAKGGDAYNTLRKEGIQAEMDALGGEQGEAMGEVYAIIGKNRARKENLEAQYLMEVRDTVLNGKHGELWGEIDEGSQGKLDKMHDDFLSWTAKLAESEAAGDEKGAALASANIEALYEAAEGMGKSLFDNSEFMKTLGEVERDEIAMIRENTAGLVDIVQNIYLKTQELSKGGIAGMIIDGVTPDMLATSRIDTLKASKSEPHADEVPPTMLATSRIDALKSSRSHAFGLDRVPFDGYPALLHEGERVLTAREAREQDRVELPPLIMQRPPAADAGTGGGAGGTGGGIQLTVTGNDFVGTGEEMADQLMEVIVRKLETAFTAAGR